MSEHAQKCENNAILGKTILKNCLMLIKWPEPLVSYISSKKIIASASVDNLHILRV